MKDEIANVKVHREQASIYRDGPLGFSDTAFSQPSSEQAPEPPNNVKVPPEQALRKRLKEEERDAYFPGQFNVTPVDVAEYCALWGMGQYEAPLAWLPRTALSLPLPPGILP